VKAVSNAGPIIHLSWINRLDILGDLFEQIVIPTAVRNEVLRAGTSVPGVLLIKNALEAGSILTSSLVERAPLAQLTVDLDLGEAEAI
jgi:uncharacterized protein